MLSADKITLQNRITSSYADNDPGPPHRVIRKERERAKSPTRAARENKNRITHTQAKRLLSVLLSVIRGKHQHLFELRCENCTKPRPADLICFPRITIQAPRGFCYPGILVGGLEKCYPENWWSCCYPEAQDPGVIRLLSGKKIGLLRAPRFI